MPQTLLQAACSIQMQYPDVSFQFYSGDATDVTERLDHGSLDFAILRFLNNPKAITQTITDSKEPPGAASPIGYSVSGKYRDAK